MGKHNKVSRKKYWKRCKRRFTGKESNEVECSSTYSMQEQNHGGVENDFDHADKDSEDQTGLTCSFQNYLDTCDDDHENQNDRSPENSLISSDYQ